MRRALLLLSLLTVTACSHDKSIFVAAEPTPEQGSVVYLYRPYDVSNVMLQPEVRLAGSKLSLRNGEYRMLYLSPGNYPVVVEAIEAYTPAREQNLRVKPGSVHYLRLDSSVRLDTGLRYRSYQRGFELTQVAAEQARHEIIKCHDADAVVTTHKPSAGHQEGAAAEHDDAFFSTDKTANPFSH